jgi:zinc protease
MQRLLIEPQWLEPEKGAVLAEMHGYENDPASVLHDAVVFAAFQGHPYRNNVIGWESDILALQHQDVLDFYRQHYLPANAVLAVVGNFDSAGVSAEIGRLFGGFPVTPATPLPHTREPGQQGERRIELLGGGSSSHFEIAWRAPAASHPDFAAMLVLQEWLSGGSGVNFMQEFGSTPVQPGTALDGKVADLRSWFPPAAEEYLFSLQGSIAEGQDAAETEALIESVLLGLRSGEITDEAVQAAKARVQEQLVFDLGTHEETAHQLAYFAGLNALDEWLNLPARVAAVGKADLVNLAQRRLQPWQRTTGWYRSGSVPQIPPPLTESPTESSAESRAESIPALPASKAQASRLHQPLPPAEQHNLDNGVQLLLQPNPASNSVFLSLLVRGSHWQGSEQLQTDSPLWGLSSLNAQSLPGKLESTLELLLAEAAKLQFEPPSSPDSTDPSTQLEVLLQRMLGLDQREITSDLNPVGRAGQFIEAVVIAGQIDGGQLQSVQRRLKQLSPPKRMENKAAVIRQGEDIRVDWPAGLAQAQLGYAVVAPHPGGMDKGGADHADAPDHYPAWRALQYILAHDYEGRLGKEAISNRGLAYYLDSQYRSDGRNSWSSISTGVDPAKLETLEALFREYLDQLREQPPSEAEVAEAKSYLKGRALTSLQSNVELAAGLAEQWLWFERLPSQAEQLQRIDSITLPQVLALLPRFTEGNFAVIGAGKVPVNVTD